MVVALVFGGVAAAWGLWSFARIDRVDLELAEARSSEPRNFLVVGSDSREGISEDDPDAAIMVGGETPAGRRADSLMVVRVDPGEERIDLLSVPRDLWVPISPTGREQRINTSYSESAQAAVDTVQDALDIPIHHYVEVDFRGFQGLVDALDGVPMYFENPVRDRNSGLVISDRGCAMLDGHQGLAFARSRYLQWREGGEWHSDPTGDLGRSTRQQLLARAAMARAQSLGLNDVGKVRRLVEAGIDSVTLDATVGASDLIALANQLSDVDPDRMQTHGLPVTPHRTAGGAEVVLLDPVAAKPVLDLFRGDVSSAPVTTTTAPPPSEDEVTVDVLNGSGTDGEARRVSYVLDDGGFEIGSVDSATPRARTIVEHAPGATEAPRLVARWLSPDAELVASEELRGLHVQVTLGANFRAVAEPGAPSTDDGAEDAAGPTGDEVDTDSGTAPVASTTTTTQPGWVPGTPPAGSSCS